MGYNPYSLENKLILVTGASSGIGRAIAIEASRMGANLIITARNQNELEKTKKMLAGDNHFIIPADLEKQDDIEKIISSIHLTLDGLVNCAGVIQNLPFQYATREKIAEVMNVNFYGSAELTRLLLKKKKFINNSSIVFISSISGIYCSSVAGSVYAASKGAINGLIKGLALDIASKGIRVNSVNPGVITTDIFSAGSITEEQLKEDIKKYPLKRHGRPEEVAYAVIYLLSDAAKWVTGSNILIDGGYTLL